MNNERTNDGAAIILLANAILFGATLNALIGKYPLRVAVIIALLGLVANLVVLAKHSLMKDAEEEKQ